MQQEPPERLAARRRAFADFAMVYYALRGGPRSRPGDAP